MKKLVVLLILAVAAWGGYRHFTAGTGMPAAPPMAANASSARPAAPVAQPAPTPAYTCDGRTHCSQMRSCEEATYFIQHCPSTEMDGDGDGVPCERQWCG